MTTLLKSQLAKTVKEINDDAEKLAQIKCAITVYDTSTGKALGVEQLTLPVNYPKTMVELSQKYHTFIKTNVTSTNYAQLCFNNLQELNDLAYDIDCLGLRYKLTDSAFKKLLAVRAQLDEASNATELNTIKLALALRYPVKIANDRIFIGFRIADRKACGGIFRVTKNNHLVLDN